MKIEEEVFGPKKKLEDDKHLPYVEVPEDWRSHLHSDFVAVSESIEEMWEKHTWLGKLKKKKEKYKKIDIVL